MNVRDRDMGGFVDEARTRVAKEAPLPAGMSIEWGGEFESKERAMRRLQVVVPVALVITLMLLFKAFDSFSLALLTLLNVPFALIGGVFALRAFAMPLSVAAAVGFIALIGQASLNGVLVVSAIAERHRAGMPVERAITAGCRERLRPVLMTSLLAALGLVPAARSRAIGCITEHEDVERPAFAMVDEPLRHGLECSFAVQRAQERDAVGSDAACRQDTLHGVPSRPVANDHEPRG